MFYRKVKPRCNRESIIPLNVCVYSMLHYPRSVSCASLGILAGGRCETIDPFEAIRTHGKDEMNLPNIFPSPSTIFKILWISRRFLLKYIQKVAWPAIQSEPVRELERHMDLGIRFHKIIHQMYLGMDDRFLSTKTMK